MAGDRVSELPADSAPASAHEAIAREDALYRALLAADRSEAMVPLAAGLAGELNDLLAQILGGITVARGAEPGDALAVAESAALAARDVVRRLNAIGIKGEAGRLATAPRAMLEEAAAAAAVGQAAEVLLAVEEGTEPVTVNRSEMQQAFRALVRNAAEAMTPAPQRPRILLRAKNTEIAAGQVADLAAGPYVEFEVRDNGCGVPPDILEKIWEPFFTTKKHGSGLGLPTALAAVRRHGGQIGIDSSAGVGTVITIFLPRAQRLPAAGGARAAASRFRTGRVLVMDGDEKLRGVLAGLLQRLDYKCDTVRDADEAATWYRRYLDIGRPYDAAIADLKSEHPSPDSALTRLKELDPDARVIAMSPLPPEKLAGIAADHGYTGWLAKPFQLSELAEVLQTVLG